MPIRRSLVPHYRASMSHNRGSEPHYGAPGDTTEAWCLTTEGPCVTTEGPCVTTEGLCVTTDGRCPTTDGRCLTTDGRCLTTEGRCPTTEGRCLTTEAPCVTTEASVVSPGGSVVRHRASVVSPEASVVRHGAPRRSPGGPFVTHHNLSHNGGGPFVSQRITAEDPGRTAASPVLSPGTAAPSAEPPPSPALAQGPPGREQGPCNTTQAARPGRPPCPEVRILLSELQPPAGLRPSAPSSGPRPFHLKGGRPGWGSGQRASRLPLRDTLGVRRLHEALSRDPRSGKHRRHHLYDRTLQRAFHDAVQAGELVKPATCHTLSPRTC
jgi:hypothetical protein